MYSRQRHCRSFAIITAAVFSGFAVPALSADTAQLLAVPDKCISLVRGQTCYLRVQLRWKSLDDAHVQKVICIWREGDSTALMCWEGVSNGNFRYDLEAAETTNFYLVAGREQQPVVGRATVKVSWVYNNRASRSSRWRLF